MTATAITTLQEYFETVYLPEHLKDKRPATRQAFCRTIDRFIAYNRGDVKIADVTPEAFTRYLQWYVECNRGAPNTAKDDIVRLRRMLAAAGRADLRYRYARPKIPDGSGLPRDLQRFFADVFCEQRVIGPRTIEQLRVVIDSIEDFHGKAVTFDDLPAIVNRWLEYLELRVAPRTVKSKRAGLITLWLAAYDNGVCPKPETRRIRKPKCPRPTPDAWTMKELQALIDAAVQFRGEHYATGIDRGLFWDALIRVCYDTGLRRGDLLTLKFSQLETDDEGEHVLRTVQSKTGDGIVHRLHPTTVQALRAIAAPERETIFDWPHTKETFARHWHDILIAAGQKPTRRNGLQKLRRTSASHLEAEQPGAATLHLGHRCGDMARLHYIDPKIAHGKKPMPPAIK